MQYPNRIPQPPNRRRVLSRPYSERVFELYYCDNETNLHQVGLFKTLNDVIVFLEPYKISEQDRKLLLTYVSNVFCCSVPGTPNGEFQVSSFNVYKQQVYERINFDKREVP